MESFLTLIQKRFNGKDNTVPKNLEDTVNAYNFVEKQNIKHPNIIAVLDNIEEINEIDLPDKFVIKTSNISSGVMLLEKISNNKYFDHISLNEYDLNTLISKQKQIVASIKKEGIYWVVEELLENFLSNKFIPFQYKLYYFQGKPKLIIQIDRNSSPPKIAIFDGTFMPLINGKDYNLDLEELVPGNHIIPTHPISILKTAYVISKAINNKFFSIELFDTPDGVYFGKLTFTPTSPDIQNINLSYEILSNFNLCLDNRNKCSKNFDTNKYFFLNHIQFNNSINSIDRDDYDYHNNYFNRLLIRVYNGDKRVIRRIVSAFSIEQEKIHDKNVKLLYQHFSLCWKMISYYNGDNYLTYNIIQDVYRKNGFITNKRIKMDNIIQDCKNFLYSKGYNSLLITLAIKLAKGRVQNKQINKDNLLFKIGKIIINR